MLHHKFFSRFIILIISLSFSSCVIIDDDDKHPYYSPLVGSWELLEDDYGRVPQAYVDVFNFDNNGYGTYEAYDEYNRWTQWRFTWDEYYDYHGNIIDINFGHNEIWSYYWEIHHGYLYLYDGYNTLIYRPLY